MKKHIIVFLILCLFAFACEQENISTEFSGQNYELNDREARCDLKQIPLYISPEEATESDLLDFATVFPVTASAEYESANGSNITIQHVSYKVNESPVAAQFGYQNNAIYNLAVDVKYSIDNENLDEVFSLAFRITSGQKIEWRDANFCLYEGREYQESSDDIYFRTIESLILP